MRDRGVDFTIFSPIAGQMGHHIGNRATSETWSAICNELIHRVCTLYPDKFVGVCQLPQSPGVAPANCIPELERCVKEYGFIGCNLNPDPSGGYWTDPPLTDKWWYPLYEKMVELDVPAMVHVSGSCNPNFHHTGAHYINGDTTAFMQFLTSDLFKDFPTLKFIIPHGGGAVPYHWGRYQGLAQDMKRPPLKELLLKNVYFDTCVYHRPGIELLLKVIPADNILFAQEIFGAVKGVNPETPASTTTTPSATSTRSSGWSPPTARRSSTATCAGSTAAMPRGRQRAAPDASIADNPRFSGGHTTWQRPSA